MEVVQDRLGDLGTPLAEVTFVVVDLETTGGSARDCGITEIGAVKVRGGEELGELQTFVNPGEPIPAFIQSLTGITDAMVADAPRTGEAVASFLEFARGAVLVAHNAGFDIGFLKAACAAHDLRWPGPTVLDTVRLARQVVSRDEVPNHKLGTLARYFGATTTPDHRALHDARATVDVLHALIGRLGSVGVHTLEELSSYTSRVSDELRRKRHLADGLPSAPGVYVFKDERGEPLYVGTSIDIRSRARSYFTASEQRRRMGEMVRLATEITPIVCATTLEAQVRELRLIARHKPRYNRRSRHPERAWWLKLTDEVFPRLSIVRSVGPDDLAFAGPFGTRGTAEEAMAALHDAVPLRQCLTRLSPRRPTSACALADMGRCSAPCTGEVPVEDYAVTVAEAAQVLVGDSRSAVAALRERMAELSAQERFEEAGALRDRLADLVRAASRSQRAAPLTAAPELVAARRTARGGWDLVCVRHGRLAGSSHSPSAPTRCPTSRPCAPAPRWSRRPRGRARAPCPRRPSSSCAGSRLRAPGWSTSRASGPAPWAVPLPPTASWRLL
ncbi:DEDD exonuclease domain-containing protein [Janibacter sp. CX7]|uniref:DEDD exonuclease domain-containing protein n=1 Tax=Janibacter sp. CX7 TaxID=2963431 RepID=UPI00350E3CF0